MSAFADALVQGVIAQMDPSKAMEREAMSGYLEIQKSNVIVNKGSGVDKLAERLIALKAAGFSDTSVPVVSVEKLISQLAE